MNLVQRAVEKGGKLHPLVIQDERAVFGVMNPSIFIDSDGDILINLRIVNYTLYHSENNQQFPSPWGPLAYLHPEQDRRLATENYLCLLDKDLNIVKYTKVDMMVKHEPIWEFHGLEDCRVVEWPDWEDDTKKNLYLIGVRRDTTPNGQGRMEYSQIELDKEKWTAKEVHRLRIPAPAPNDSYCEKNWAPILDKPYHFIKWSMPTEIVKARPDIPSCNTVEIKETPPSPKDQRGGSQVVRWGDYYISFTHEVDLWKNYLTQKDAIYRHRMLVWDKDFNFVGLTNSFSFLDFRIEFCVGAAVLDGDLLISFAAADNVAFIVRTPGSLVDTLIEEAKNYGNR